MLDILTTLQRLAEDRPIFHSEADFQHALAWQIHKEHPDFKVRLEYWPHELDWRAYVDIWLQGAVIYAIELKYKTRPLATTVNDECFDLRNHSAHDFGRYDFCKDISRVETLAKVYPGLIGLGVFLTNDCNYWRESDRAGNADALFCIHEGRRLTGDLSWAGHLSSGTTKGRTEPIELEGKYQLKWSDYSNVHDGRGGQFRMLVLSTEANA